MSVKPVCPRSTRRSIIAAACGLVLAGGGGKFAAAQDDPLGLPDAADAMDRVMPAKPPLLAFSNSKGRQLGLADYAGRVLVVNLWATWCGPCVAEIPSFAALVPRIKASGALVLPISIDLSGADAVRPFYAAHGIKTLPILLDPDGNNMQALGADGIPVTIVINAAGQMVARLEGAANWNTQGVVDFLGTLGTKAAPAPGFIPV